MASRSSKKRRIRDFFNIQIFIGGAVIFLLVWLIATMAMGTEQKTLFLPGVTSQGHFGFEANCSSCHEGFKKVSNENCSRCHEAELAEDKHGEKKFRDIRWAEDLEKLDALTCTTCHNEHVQMYGRGVHLQPDLCMACHQGIIEGDMTSHDGFTADGCWTAGCHNYHDHRSISTGFLYDGLDQPPMLPVQELPKIVVEAQLETAPNPDLKSEFLGGGS